MWVFIDESGDTGFKFEANSSTHFVLAAVVFPDAEEAERCREDIRAFRKTMRLPAGEMKFNGSAFELRAGFLRAVAGRDFWVESVVVDKRRLRPADYKPGQKLYEKAVSLLMGRLLPKLSDASVCLDRSGNRSFRSVLRRVAKESITDDTWPVRHWTDQDSKSDLLLQMADIVCGAIARETSGRKDGDRFRRLIRRFESGSRVWPEPSTDDASPPTHEKSPPV